MSSKIRMRSKSSQAIPSKILPLPNNLLISLRKDQPYQSKRQQTTPQANRQSLSTKPRLKKKPSLCRAPRSGIRRRWWLKISKPCERQARTRRRKRQKQIPKQISRQRNSLLSQRHNQKKRYKNHYKQKSKRERKRKSRTMIS